jgi:branched-chain amino acid transport system ATP-binding protein
MGVVQELADRVAVLCGGELLADGRPEAVRADARVQQAYLGTAAGEAGAVPGEAR